MRRSLSPNLAPPAPTHLLIPLTPPPAVLSDSVPLVLSRQLLLAFAQGLHTLPPDAQRAVAL